MTALIPAPGAQLPTGPYECSDDGTITASDGMVLLVLGDPNEGLAEAHVTLGAAILALPAMVQALNGLIAIRPTNWDDEEDPDQVAAWTAADEAVALAEGRS